MENLNFIGFPPAYKSAAEELVKNLSSENLQFCEKNEIFYNFCKHFSVVPKLWKEWIPMEHVAKCTNPEATAVGDRIISIYCTKIMQDLFHLSSKHFYIDIEIFESHNLSPKPPHRKLITFPDFDKLFRPTYVYRLRNVKFLKQALVIPHVKLEEVLKLYERFSDAPLNAVILKEHENAKNLYKKIMAAKTEIELLNLLLETSDEEFIVENIEFRLSENPCNKEIWTFYLNYFEKQSNIRLLNLYRRYCRLFIEDSKIQEIYAKKIEYFQNDGFNVEIWINDLTDFYEYFKIPNDKQVLPNLSNPCTQPFKTLIEPKKIPATGDFDSNLRLFGDEIIYKKCQIYFNSINSLPQEFSFPKTIMHYLTLKNCIIKSYRKIIQTCKYFFSQKQVIPIWHLNVTWQNIDFFHQNSLYLGFLRGKERYVGEEKPPVIFKNQIWLEDSIKIHAPEFRVLDKLYQSDIKYLHLRANITLKEYDLLVKSKKIREIVLSNIIIATTPTTTESLAEEEEETPTIERLMKWLPNAYKIGFHVRSWALTPPIKSSSSPLLSELKRNVKIEELGISKITEALLEPNEFYKFFKANITSKSVINIHFKSPINENYQNEMNEAVKKVMTLFTDENNELPKIKLHF